MREGRRATATSSRRFDKELVFGVIRGTQTTRMLSYNIDSPETRSQVRLPTIVGRMESERGSGREGGRKGKREGGKQRKGEGARGKERSAVGSSARSSNCRARVHEEVEETSCFPQWENNALNRFEGKSNLCDMVALRFPLDYFREAAVVTANKKK